MEHGVLVHVLPPEQIADEIRRRHGFYLAPQLAERHAVDAGEKHAVAPLGFGFGREINESAAQHRSLSLQGGEGDLHIRPRETDARGEFCCAHGAGRLGPAPDDGEGRLIRRGRLRLIPLVGNRLGMKPDSRNRRAHERHPLRRHPALPFDTIHLPLPFRHAVLIKEFIYPGGPFIRLFHRQNAQGEQRVVQLVRVTRGRPSLLAHLLDDVRVEPGALRVIGQCSS